MRQIKAVFFDLDDTLWPIVPVIIRAEERLFRWLKRRAPEVAEAYTIESLRARRKAILDAHPHYLHDLEELRRVGLLEAFSAVGENPDLAADAMKLFIRARNDVTLYPDTLPVLGALQDKVVVGSITNGTGDLRDIGLSKFFRISLSARQVRIGKPDPRIFIEACRQASVAPEETAYVGDDPLLDVAAAQNAGLQAIWINRSGAEPQTVLPDNLFPDAVFTTLFELEQWIDERNQ